MFCIHFLTPFTFPLQEDHVFQEEQVPEQQLEQIPQEEASTR